MAKKKFHVIKYINHKAFLFNNDYEAFIKERKQAKGAVTKGFNEFEKAIEWIGDLPYEIIVQKDTKTLSLAPTAENKKITYYAVVRGRRVGVMKSHAAFMEATKGYKNAKAKGGFKTKKQAVEWLAKQGISPENKKGIYVVVRGFQTGVFIDLHSYEKNLSGYPNAIGQGGFRNIEIATNWLNKQKNANQKNTNVKKEQKEVRSSTEEQLYHAIVIGKETGIFTDRNQYEENLKGIPNSWGKDGFQSKKEATEWLNERLTFIQKNITKEQIISFESKNLPVIYTDGSYIKDEKTYSSSVIICEEEGTIATFAKGNKKEANNKIAEVEALLYALKLVVDF